MQLEKGTGLLRASLGVLVLAGSAFAQEPAPPPAGSTSVSDSGFSFGIRSGYSIPLGQATGDTGAQDISKTISGAIPLWADIGYRFASNWYVGGYFQYGIGLPNNCNNPASCTFYDMRFGANAHYYFMPGEMLNPWVGLGGGWEILNLQVTPTAGATSQTVQVNGWEGNAHVGLDWMVSPQFGVGPFVTFTVSQYLNQNFTNIPLAPANGSITNKSVHEWLVFGLRGKFDLTM